MLQRFRSCGTSRHSGANYEYCASFSHLTVRIGPHTSSVEALGSEKTPTGPQRVRTDETCEKREALIGQNGKTERGKTVAFR